MRSLPHVHRGDELVRRLRHGYVIVCTLNLTQHLFEHEFPGPLQRQYTVDFGISLTGKNVLRRLPTVFVQPPLPLSRLVDPESRKSPNDPTFPIHHPVGSTRTFLSTFKFSCKSNWRSLVSIFSRDTVISSLVI